jgi:hypothetical protein
MTDRARGIVRADILDERVLSAIVEFKTAVSEVERYLGVVERVAPTLDTVVSLGVSSVCDEDGGNPVEAIMRRRGYPVIRGKTNLGLGRRTNTGAAAVAEAAS